MIQKRMELICVSKSERQGKQEGNEPARFYYNATLTGMGFTWVDYEITQQQYNQFQAGGEYLVEVALIPAVAKFEGRFRAEPVYKIQLGAIREKSPPPGPDPRTERPAAAPEAGDRRPVSAGAGG